MATVQQALTVEAPLSVVYNQWTQFEEFPQFMEGVTEVQQKGDTNLHWRANIAGTEEQWDAVITEQVPDQRIAWRSTSGARNDGIVSFQKIDEYTTRIQLQLDYEPEGAIEQIGSALGLVESRVKGDLERFKTFIEERQQATGAWRGTVQSGTAR